MRTHEKHFGFGVYFRREMNRVVFLSNEDDAVIYSVWSLIGHNYCACAKKG